MNSSCPSLLFSVHWNQPSAGRASISIPCSFSERILARKALVMDALPSLEGAGSFLRAISNYLST